jgi:hypothetical protein
MFRSVSKLSQAAAHPRRGTNYTRNGISCKECAYATQQEQKKQRRKAVYIKDLHARNDATKQQQEQCAGAHKTNLLLRAAPAPEFRSCSKKIGKVPDDLPCKRAIK